MKETILIVDDDKEIREMLSNYYIKEGFEVRQATNGKEGIEILKVATFSLILLDIMMPEMDGYTMLLRLREISNIPVILLTAKDQQVDKIKGFINGCDDYIVKPFDFTELSLRVRAILKRTSINNKECGDILSIKDIKINPTEYTVKKGNIEIILTPKEFEILHTLAANKGRVYSTNMIYETVWKEAFIETDNTVTMHIKNLREKLGDTVKEGKYIKTIWGLGYKIEKDI